MFCSSVATREVVDGANMYFRSRAEGDARWRAIAEAVGSFYSTFNVFQLDFSDALQLPCLDVAPFAVEKVYAVVVYVVLFAWTFLAVFITVRSRGIASPQRPGVSGSSNSKSVQERTKKNKRNKLVPVDPAAAAAAAETGDAGAIEMVDNTYYHGHNKPESSTGGEDASSMLDARVGHSSSGQSTKTLSKLAAIHHRLNTAGYVLYAVTCKIALTLLHCPAADADADCHTAGQRPPELIGVMMGLVVFHLIFFPIASFCAAARVHRRTMGGSCCGDSPATVQSQLSHHKSELQAEVEIIVWRYVLRW